MSGSPPGTPAPGWGTLEPRWPMGARARLWGLCEWGRGGWDSSHGVGVLLLPPFPCVERSRSKVQHLSWGGGVIRPGAGPSRGFQGGLGGVCLWRSAHRAGQGGACSCCIAAFGSACCPPSPTPAAWGPLPPFLPALASSSPLSFSLSLLLSRWPLGGRWMSGVYGLPGRAGRGAPPVGVGLLSACGRVPACGLWLPWLPAPAPQLVSHPHPASLTRSWPPPQAENGEGPPITPVISRHPSS